MSGAMTARATCPVCGGRTVENWGPRRCSPNPRVAGVPLDLTVFYGERCRAEAKLLAPLKGLPDVSIRPQPTASHFSMIPLLRIDTSGFSCSFSGLSHQGVNHVKKRTV